MELPPNKAWPKGEFERRLKTPVRMAVRTVLFASAAPIALRSNIGGPNTW